MKMPIEWHEKNLRCQRDSLSQGKQRFEAPRMSLESQEQEIYFLEEQIQEAKRRGKDGFDAERFLWKRGT